MGSSIRDCLFGFLGRTKSTQDTPENAVTEGGDFARFQSVDPFPDVAPALLNSADIHDYALVTHMIAPFRKERLKPASYRMALLGDYVYWDETGKKVSGCLLDKQSFKLPKNSIAFVSLDTEFRLPKYIAARFNLKVLHAHRGILLGTGPLVDPGFTGALMIPLHNFTATDYELRAGDTLIEVEFTKLSPNRAWIGEPFGGVRQGLYRDFVPDVSTPGGVDPVY
jgi:deoxycytidine triphosphate deaminase